MYYRLIMVKKQLRKLRSVSNQIITLIAVDNMLLYLWMYQCLSWMVIKLLNILGH